MPDERAERRNYGLAGGTLKPPPPWMRCLPSLAFALRMEAIREREDFRWTRLEARLYAEIGIDQAEHHANWGV